MARSGAHLAFLLILAIGGILIAPSQAVTFKVDLNGSNEAFAVASYRGRCSPCLVSRGCACGSTTDVVHADLYMTALCNGSYVMFYTFTAVALNESDSVEKAHIHKVNRSEQSGGHVVTLFDEGFNNATFKVDKVASGTCRVDPLAYTDVTANPDGYYLNIHTDLYAKGAVRGQLKMVNEPPPDLRLWNIPTGALAASVTTSPPSIVLNSVKWMAMLSFSADYKTFNHSFQLVGLGANETIIAVQIVDGASGPEAWDLTPAVNVTELALTGFTWAFNAPALNATLAQAIYQNPGRYYVKVATSTLGEMSPTSALMNMSPAPPPVAPGPPNGVSRNKGTGFALTLWIGLAIAAAFGL